jgi:hypothetical protein
MEPIKLTETKIPPLKSLIEYGNWARLMKNALKQNAKFVLGVDYAFQGVSGPVKQLEAFKQDHDLQPLSQEEKSKLSADEVSAMTKMKLKAFMDGKDSLIPICSFIKGKLSEELSQRMLQVPGFVDVTDPLILLRMVYAELLKATNKPKEEVLATKFLVEMEQGEKESLTSYTSRFQKQEEIIRDLGGRDNAYNPLLFLKGLNKKYDHIKDQMIITLGTDLTKTVVELADKVRSLERVGNALHKQENKERIAMMMDENKQRKSKGGDMQSSSVGRRGRKEPHQSKKRVHWGDKNQSNKKPKIVGCFNCGSKDHMAKDCPNPAKCRKCGQEGHIQKECIRDKKS